MIWFSLVKTKDKGCALALFRKCSCLTLDSSFFLALSVGLHSQPLQPFQNVNPRKLLFVGLTTLVLLALTLRRSLDSSQRLTDAITLSAAISLFSKTSDLPLTSFRPNVTVGTLSLAVRLPLLGRARDLHPLDYAHVGRTSKGATALAAAPGIMQFSYLI